MDFVEVWIESRSVRLHNIRVNVVTFLPCDSNYNTYVFPKWPCGLRRESACWDCGFEYHRGNGCLSLVSDVCCQVEVSVTGWSLVQRSPNECGVSECDREASIMRRSWPTRGCCAIGNIKSVSKQAFMMYIHIHNIYTYVHFSYVCLFTLSCNTNRPVSLPIIFAGK
jgi:hypothetical protein